MHIIERLEHKLRPLTCNTPAEGPERAEAATDAAPVFDLGRIGGEEQLEVGVGDAQLPEEGHANVAVLLLLHL